MTDLFRPVSDTAMIETLREMLRHETEQVAVTQEILSREPLDKWREVLAGEESRLAALQYALERLTWRSISDAPKDGRAVFLLSAPEDREYEGCIYHHPPKCHVGYWWPEGDSWVDENGHLGGDCYQLQVTGIWVSGGGWFQPNEVTHWMPLPDPPALPDGPTA